MVENLDEDLAYIKARILGDRYQPEPISTGTSNATGAGIKLASYYDSPCGSLVQALYKKDFDRFNYPRDFPV